MAVAAIMLPSEPDFRLRAFTEGLERHGFTVQRNVPPEIDPEDVVVVWNRHGNHDLFARAYEKASAKVIVAENGYVGVDSKGRQFYAIALDHHNGAGRWHVGDEPRWQAQGLGVGKWRPDPSGHVLILPQRGVGPTRVAMPIGWGEKTAAELASLTGREIRIRPHPGGKRQGAPLHVDLDGCWAAVVWASSAGIKSIMAGVPVYHAFGRWIGADAARPLSWFPGNPYTGDRELMMRKVSWAQWSVEEIASGLPFEYLLAI